MEFKWTKPVDNIVHKLINDRTQLFVAETCAKYMDKFVPMDSGTLAQSYTTEPKKVIYNAPYATHVYYGDWMRFQKEKHPLATARWDSAMKSAYGPQIAQEVTEFIRRGSR